MKLNPGLMALEHDGKRVMLPARPFALAQVMMARPEQIFTRAQLLDAIDPTMKADLYERTIDTSMKHLRRNCRYAFGHDNWWVTVYGAGYYFDPAPKNARKVRARQVAYVDPAKNEHLVEKIDTPTETNERALLFNLWKKRPD